MNINLKTIIFIILITTPLTCAGFYGQVKVETPEMQNFKLMKHQLKSGTSCLTGDLYNAIRDSSASMKYYCEFVCSQYKRYNQPNYISSKYGQQGEKLGEGSFGIVYKYIGQDGTEYAIKIPKSFKFKELFEELNSSQCIKEKMSSFYREKMGIIRECVTPSGGSPHLVMYFFGQTLEEKMKIDYKYDMSTYSLDKLKSLYTDMLYLAGELRELHKIGLAHRDLKPENAMINKENIPVLVDFGMTTPNLLNAKTVCGTPLFMDPEVITYKNTGGATADVYALGIIYYIMMTGDSGWDNVNSMAMSGGYGTMLYRPNFASLGLTGEKAFIMNMLISSKKGYGRDSRWNIEKVYQYVKAAFNKLNEPPKQPEYQAPQMTNQHAQSNVTYATKVQVDKTNQVIQNAQNVMYGKPAQKYYSPPQKPMVQGGNLLPYYTPVHVGGGENLNQFGQHVNQQQIMRNIQRVEVQQPRVVRVVKQAPIVYTKRYVKYTI